MRGLISRRDALKILSGVTGALVVPYAVQAQPREIAPPDPRAVPTPSPAPTYLRVSVHQPGGDHLEQEASVTLQDGDAIVLRRTRPKATYEAIVTPGPHRIIVRAEGYADVDYAINVPPEGLALPVYLGKPGWPWFHMGQSIIPFEPKEELIGIAFSGRPPTEARWPSLLQQMERMGLVPYPDRSSYLGAAGSIAFFKAGKPGQKIFGTGDERAPELIEKVVQLFGRQNAKVGMPLDVRAGKIKILDNSYVIRFGSKRAARDVRSLACTQQAIAYPAPYSPDTWIFEFDERNDYRRHLSSLDELRERDPDVLYAEPNLIVELQKHACAEVPPALRGQSCPDMGAVHSCSPVVASNATDDPWSRCQTSLMLQGVPDAWCFLEQTLGAANKRGSPDVCIATLDDGINKEHPDVTAGSLQYVELCDSCWDMKAKGHGMAVYGIVSAMPDNEKGTSGIAPGVRHLAVEMDKVWNIPLEYAAMLLWVAGVESPDTFREPPLARPADIISCSHGLADLPTAMPIAHALERLAKEGRKRAGKALGTIVVCSSGNESCEISGTQALATDPHVIVVGNTLPQDSSGEEKRAPTSNFGDSLDLCAQGEGAPSLLVDSTQVANGTCLPNPGPGAFEFEGTSAACPMVAATVALMLSVNKNLASADVRALLRQTARCIDPDGGAWQGGRSYFYGSGRLDVHAAVRAAAAQASP